MAGECESDIIGLFGDSIEDLFYEPTDTSYIGVSFGQSPVES
jgi:hypothetical protein